MELVARLGRSPAEIETFAQAGEGATARALERFTLAHQRFQAVGDYGAYRTTFLRRDQPGLAEKFRIEFKRNVRLHRGLAVIANVTTCAGATSFNIEHSPFNIQP
jgi:hypothetical protein